MPHDDERELRRLLNEAHRALDSEPPPFEATMAAVRRRGERRRARLRIAAVGTAGATAATVLTILAFLVVRERERPQEMDAIAALRLAESLSAWKAPTDFLRRPPGAELLEGMPRFRLDQEITRLNRSPGPTPGPTTVGGESRTEETR